MTFRQVNAALEKISYRKDADYAAHAALFGHKVKPLKPDPSLFEPIIRTEEEQKALDAVLAETLSNLKKT